MHLFSHLIIPGLILLFFYKLILRFIEGKRRAKEAAYRGCLPVPRLPWTDPLSLLRLLDRFRATRKLRGPPWFARVMAEVGPRVNTVYDEFLGYELLMTSDPENVKAMLASQTQDFEIASSRTGGLLPMLGKGVFTSTGEKWKHSRAMVRMQLSRETVSNLDLVERHIQTLMEVLETKEDGWTDEVDLNVLMPIFTFNVIAEMLLGESGHSLKTMCSAYQTNPRSKRLLNITDVTPNISAATKYSARRATLGKRYWIVDSPAFRWHIRRIHACFDRYIQDGLQRHKEAQKREGSKIKENFIMIDELAQYTQDPIALRGEIFAILFAARSSTSALIAWLFYFLAQNPRVFNELRAVVLEEFGTRYQSKEVTFSGLKSCRYLHHCLNEALRLGAPVAVNLRMATQDTTLPRGGGPDGKAPIFVPKGMDIMYVPFAMQHRQDIWGSDVEKFKPERWEDRKFGWEFVPFGAGPRICVGQQFALTETAHVVVRILQRFDQLWSTDPPGLPTLYDHVITCTSGRGVKVKFHEAEQ